MAEKLKKDEIKICATTGCMKEAKLQCPTCSKLKLPPNWFCDQVCFKEFWPIHKFAHKVEDKSIKKDTFKYTGPLRPYTISKMRTVPEEIVKPDYYYTGLPTEELKSMYQNQIEVKSEEDIEKLRVVGKLGREVLDYAHSLVGVGVTTDEIDIKTHDFIIANGAYPSPLNYHKFPKSLCTSVNEVICHGIPDSRPLEDGDIVNLDITVFKHGVHADLNETYTVGNAPKSSLFLIEKAYRSLEEAIKLVKPGTMYRDVGNAIEQYILANGLSVTRSYTGHGIGRLFHCAPNVPHYAKSKAVGFMKAGHVFTIEPMINQGTFEDVRWNDDWTAVTADGQRSAQFEHTLLVTSDGCEVLTARTLNSPPLSFKI